MADIRCNPNCRAALAILAEGPCYLQGAGRWFGSRRGQPLIEGRVKHRTRVMKPLIHVDVAGELCRAEAAKIVRTGRFDRAGTYMLVLTDYGRAVVAVLQARKPSRTNKPAPIKAPARADNPAPARAPPDEASP